MSGNTISNKQIPTKAVIYISEIAKKKLVKVRFGHLKNITNSFWSHVTHSPSCPNYFRLIYLVVSLAATNAAAIVELLHI